MNEAEKIKQASRSAWAKIIKLQTYIEYNNRVVLSYECQEILDSIFEGLNKGYPIETGTKLYRAQTGYEKVGLSYSPLSTDRMDAPDPEKAKGGRVSFSGIMCLYLATAWQTALAEMRPWKGAYITLVPFVTVRELNLLDLTKNAIDSIVDINVRSISKLISLNFSAPMEDYEEHVKYIFTQYLTCIIKSKDYDGVAYDSYLDSQGKNIALFDTASAQQLVREKKLYKTKKIEYVVEEDTPQFSNDSIEEMIGI